MSTTTIYLELSDEIQAALADNRLSISDIMQNETFEYTVTQGIMPPQAEEKSRTRDLVPIIVAASVAVPAIAFAISHVLTTIYSKPQIVKYYENEELRDADGSIFTDSDGNPVFKRVKCHQVLEPAKLNRPSFEASLKYDHGIVIKFDSNTQP